MDDKAMKFLLLGPHRPHIIRYLESFNDYVVWSEGKLDLNQLEDIDLIISYGYRYIIASDVIDKFPNKIINLHISYLPWNKGADPNFWSFKDSTIKGVSIHYIDKGLDTGDIIAQREVQFSINETLKSSYERLTQEIEGLLYECWKDIRSGCVKAYKQVGKGSYHCKNDLEKYKHLLTQGWDTPVTDILSIKD